MRAEICGLWGRRRRSRTAEEEPVEYSDSVRQRWHVAAIIVRVSGIHAGRGDATDAWSYRGSEACRRIDREELIRELVDAIERVRVPVERQAADVDERGSQGTYRNGGAGGGIDGKEMVRGVVDSVERVGIRIERQTLDVGEAVGPDDGAGAEDRVQGDQLVRRIVGTVVPCPGWQLQRYNVWERRRLKAKPGITGLQQVAAGVECWGSLSLKERVRGAFKSPCAPPRRGCPG